VRNEKGTALHFCCYGCSFTYSLTGVKGEEGTAGMFLARLGFAAFLSMNIMAVSWMTYDRGWTTFGLEPEALPYLEKLLFVLSVPIMLFVGLPYLRNAARELRSWRFSMESLIALGSFVAFGFSTHQVFTGGGGIYFDTATTTLVLVTAGRYIEATAKVRTSAALKKLVQLQPDVARVVEGEKEHRIPAKDVKVGQFVRVLPGERVPLDGLVIEGRTSVDESLLTGESLPAAKVKGTPVYAATLNIDGAITVRVTARQSEGVHAHIVRLMEEAQRTRSPIQQAVDRISGMFVPAVIALALATFVGWMYLDAVEEALLHALTVLVVACPCALGIGTPLASAIGIGRAAEEGILVRSTAVLERLAQVSIVAFDKTGTLTKGEFVVRNVVASGNPDELLELLAAIERNSEHPLGRAIVRYAKERGVKFLEARNVAAVPGMGISGEVFDGRVWRRIVAGTNDFMKEEQLAGVEEAGESPFTRLYVGWEGSVKGYVEVSDLPRPSAQETVTKLHRLGIETELLSGDAPPSVESIADLVGIRRVRASLRPAEKVAHLSRRKVEGTVAMVGDGINDAPSLAAADVGITLGSATDIAKESADVTILGDHLEKIPQLISFARTTLRVIQWNLIWAFGYNAIGIAFAIAGMLEPIVAAAAMVLSSLFIIVNSRRLAKRAI
jgi:heavy metal translocating P-type ATPase